MLKMLNKQAQENVSEIENMVEINILNEKLVKLKLH